jgi:hypothetical protein
MVERDLHAAWAAIRAVTVDNKARATAWTNWGLYTRQCQIDPWMRFLSEPLKQTYLIAFAARVPTGIFRNAVQVGFQSVEKALRHMAQNLLLVCFDDPR